MNEVSLFLLVKSTQRRLVCPVRWCIDVIVQIDLILMILIHPQESMFAIFFFFFSPA